jgi:hypothetical protein
MSRLARATVAALGLAVLAGATALPLLGLFLADEPASFCCRGRCCCTGGGPNEGDGRPCLRASCGCGTPGAVVIAAPLQLEAVLPRVTTPLRARARRLAERLTSSSPLDRPGEPLLPPPKRLLPV